jgi:preprotein translocase subunit YajC
MYSDRVCSCYLVIACRKEVNGTVPIHLGLLAGDSAICSSGCICADFVLVLVVSMAAVLCFLAYRQYTQAQREKAELLQQKDTAAEEVVTRSNTSGRVLQRGRGQ